METSGEGSEGRMLLWLGALFAVVHGLYWLAGVRFDTAMLHDGWQVLDVELLLCRCQEVAGVTVSA